MNKEVYIDDLLSAFSDSSGDLVSWTPAIRSPQPHCAKLFLSKCQLTRGHYFILRGTATTPQLGSTWLHFLSSIIACLGSGPSPWALYM